MKFANLLLLPKRLKKHFSNVYWKFSEDNKKAFELAPSVCLKQSENLFHPLAKLHRSNRKVAKLFLCYIKIKKRFFPTKEKINQYSKKSYFIYLRSSLQNNLKNYIAILQNRKEHKENY